MTKVFISYSWDGNDHKNWVRDFAARLRSDGVDVILDQWHLVPGDQLPEFMEREVRGSEYVLIVCTARYKTKSDSRTGGVGYEGDIMTSEVLNSRNQRKFIPILRDAVWTSSAPIWLDGKYYIDLSQNPYSEAGYHDLLTTLLGVRPSAPPVMPPTLHGSSPSTSPSLPSFSPIKISGVIVDKVGVPRDDGTRGSALYSVPFQLTARPPREWGELFVAAWNRPERFTTMHRPGIASVIGDTVVLDGTSIEEVQNHHRDTLILAIDAANQQYIEFTEARKLLTEQERDRVNKHLSNVQEAAKKIKFD